MKPAIPCLLLLGLLAARALAGSPASHAAKPSPELQRRIDVLLQRRLKPEALPLSPPNPFQMNLGAQRDSAPDDFPRFPVSEESGSPVTAAPADSPGKELATATNAEVLVSCATRLKLGGIIVLKDQIQIVVNGAPRREGDLISAEWNNAVVQLRILKLLPGQMILRYGDAEATVRF